MEEERVTTERQPGATERLEKLVGEMGAQGESLVAIVEFCAQERTSGQVDEMLAPLRADRLSVYTPSTLRRLLENAGALVYHANDVAPDELTDENGDLVMPEEAVPTWTATPEALAWCAARNPLGELADAVGTDEEIADVYARILALCDEEPHSMNDIAHVLGEEGLLGEGGRDAGSLVGKLEELGALAWHGAWETSALGRDYLDLACA